MEVGAGEGAAANKSCYSMSARTPLNHISTKTDTNTNTNHPPSRSPLYPSGTCNAEADAHADLDVDLNLCLAIEEQHHLPPRTNRTYTSRQWRPRLFKSSSTRFPASISVNILVGPRTLLFLCPWPSRSTDL